MSITIEQLQERSEARNPAQWDWRLLDASCHYAGNSPVLNTKFRRTVISSNRSFSNLCRNRLRNKMKQRRAAQRTWSGAYALPTHLKYLKLGGL